MALSKITPNSFSSFSTANTNLDNGTFFIDAVANRIGIRTTTPGSNSSNGANNSIDASFDYAIDIRGNMRLGSSANGEQDIHFYSSNNNIWQVGSNLDGASVGSAHNNLFYFYNDNLGNGSSRATNRYYLTIDGDGQMRVPNQHAFNVYKSASYSPGSVTVIYDTVRLNRGSCYSTSTGRFTAKVAGTYLFCVTNNSQSTIGDIVLRVNAGNYVGFELDSSSGGAWVGSSCQMIVSLSVGDYVDVIFTGSTSGTNIEGVPWNGFFGCLLF